MIPDNIKKILSRMQRYCALEDRSVQKIREKLYDIGELSKEEMDFIIGRLLEDQFLDDGRFVESFIRSKVNQKKWGVQKIRHGLFRHRIPEKMIDEGLRKIDQATYEANLHSLLKTRQDRSPDRNAWIRYLLQRGFEYDEIIRAIDQGRIR